MSTTSGPPGRIEQQSDNLYITGDWTLPHYAQLRREVERRRSAIDPESAFISLEGVVALDTAGASLLVELVGASRLEHAVRHSKALPLERQALLQAVSRAMVGPEAPRPEKRHSVKHLLGLTGQRVEQVWQQVLLLLGFTGQTLATLGATFWHPGRWRVTSLVVHLQQTGLNAVPIVALLTFMVGAVIAFLGATVLRQFGATIYTVDLVAFSFLREFGVLLAAILLAGRTASAFTAQIGAMKANEELDAIRTIGLNPIELLVLPRVLALVITLPILTFIGMLSGILGGAVVCLLALDITLVQFLAILQRDIAPHHLLIGLSKAPVFAFVVAIIGCLEGFKVEGSAQSVGEHTTSSVVQSIFMVILLDAVAALFFMEMGW